MPVSITLPARAHAQLVAANVRIDRGGRTVLDGVDLAVAPGARWGVVGENGRGKSTLLHALAGRLDPDDGTIRMVGTFGIAEQEMPTSNAATVGDAVDAELADARAALKALDLTAQALADGEPGAEGAYAHALDAAEVLGAWDADRRVEAALESLGAPTDRTRLLGDLSVGERYRVRLGCLLGAEHDFLLLDEPTNHLDAAGLDYLTATLRDYAGGVVLVSHDRALLSDIATTILDLDPSRDGRPRVYGGGLTGFQDGRETELARWESEYEQQRAEHIRLSQELREAQDRLVSGWRPDKGTGKHQRATRAPALARSVHRRRDALEEHALAAPRPPLRFAMPELPTRAGVTLIDANNLRVEGRLAHAVSLAVESGSRVVVSGPNGAGKSTLLAVLVGLLAPTSGTVSVARNTRVRLLAQESPTGGHRSARDEFAAHIGALVSAGLLLESEALSLGSLGLLSSADLTKPVSALSMGQQRRLGLAVALAARPHVLLLDEPTNHLSVSLVDELTEALQATSAAVVLATHDRQLRRDVAQWPRLTLGAGGSSRPEGLPGFDGSHGGERCVEGSAPAPGRGAGPPFQQHRVPPLPVELG